MALSVPPAMSFQPHTCPHCGAEHDACDSLTSDKHAPVDGDLSLCVDCGAFSVFRVDGLLCYLAKPTDDELRELSNNPDCQRAFTAWRIAAAARDKAGKA
jgi:hypothetical protein